MYKNGFGFTDSEVNSFIERRHSPIHFAACMGHANILKEIYTNFGDVICETFPSCEGDSRTLLQAPDSVGDTPLHSACRRCNFSVVKCLVEEFSADSHAMNASGLLPIHLAVAAGDVRTVKYFMEDNYARRVIFDQLDGRLGASLLHWACMNDRFFQKDWT